jgi:hypothetical protein
MSDEQLQKLSNDQSLLHIVTPYLLRPQMIECVVAIEHEHYPPGTPHNAQFMLTIIKWQAMEFAVASVPMKDKPIIEALCARHGMRLADGYPHLFEGGTCHRFPMNTPNVFTMEPDHKQPGPHVTAIVEFNKKES